VPTVILRPIARVTYLHALRASLPAVVGTRLAIFFVGYLAVVVFGFPGGRAPVRDFDDELRNLPSRFDARWYLQIAAEGYRYDPQAPASAQQNIVFFPAFPMAIRGVARMFGGGRSSFFVAGTVLSLVAFVAALAYLYLFARESVSDDEALVAVWITAAYPFAFFYGAIYTESFFLLETVAAFYHVRHRQFAAAAAWGLLAGLTRPNGCLLAAPLALVALLDWRRSTDEGARAPVSALLRAWSTATAPIGGMLLYALAIWRLTGNPFAWVAGQTAWGHNYLGISGVVTDRYRIITHAGLSGYIASLPHDFLNGLAVLFVLMTLWPVARRLGVAYGLWMILNVWPSITAVNLISAGRYTAILFPAFIWLAGAVPERHRGGWIAAFASVQAFGAAMFYTWRPLY
jgi:mannosyltransferase PIG-V